MRRFALMLFLFLLFTTFFSSEVSASLDLVIGDKLITLEVPPMVINGSILIALDAIVEYFGAELTWKTKDQVTLQLLDKTISMQIGDNNVSVDGKNAVMEVAPEMYQGHAMVPLRFLADQMGFRLGFDSERMALRLDVPQELQSRVIASDTEESLDGKLDDDIHRKDGYNDRQLKEISFLGGARSRVFIDVTNYTGYQSVLLKQPNRLVIDLYGVGGEAPEVQEIGGTIIERIRADRFDEQTMRVVFDLNMATGYEINRYPEGGLEVEFNYQITEVGFERREEEPYLTFKANEEPPFSVIHLSDPARLVIDFQNSTLIDGAREFAVEDETVRRVRVSQFMPSITRVVLELDAPLTPVVTKHEGDRYSLSLFEGTKEEAQARALVRLLAEEKTQSDSKQEMEAVLTEGTSNEVLRGRIVALDPGHGGSDPGAIGPTGVFEKDVTLSISHRLKALLEAAGAEVVMTRETDEYVSVFERPLIAAQAGADILLSIHANSYVEKVARGTETLYNPRSSGNFRLAQKMQEALVGQLQLIDRGLRPRTDLAVLNGSDIATALVEVAFLNHPEEEILLRSSGFQQAAADAIFHGIVRYFSAYGVRR